MTEQFEQAKREFAEKWWQLYLDDGTFLSDLTALLEQHKEAILRGELIAYDKWAARHLLGSSEILTAEQAVDAYLDQLKGMEK